VKDMLMPLLMRWTVTTRLLLRIGRKILLPPYCLFVFFITVVFAFSFSRSFAETEAPAYQSEGKRDPFIPYVTNDGQLINIGSEEKEFTLHLEGIIYEKDGQSLVIINGEILKQKDTIGDIKIVEIRKDSLVYMKNGELFMVKREE